MPCFICHVPCHIRRVRPLQQENAHETSSFWAYQQGSKKTYKYILFADIFSGSNTLSSKTPKCLACPGPALLAPPHRASHRDLQLQHCLPTLRSHDPPCLDALLDHFRWKHLLKTTYIFALIRCWGHLSHFRDKKCSEQVSSPPSHDNWSPDPSPGTFLQFCL